MLVLKAKEDTEELKMNSAALKQMVKMKNRELKNVRKVCLMLLLTLVRASVQDLYKANHIFKHTHAHTHALR